MRSTIRTWLTALSGAIAALAILVTPAWADTVHLKDGRVLEGDIIRENDQFLYLKMVIGQLEHEQLIIKEEVERIERSAPVKSESVPPAKKPETKKTERAVSGDAVRIAFIPMGVQPGKDMVGPYMNADALENSFEMLKDLEQPPQTVVLLFDSGGGALLEIEPLSDTIEEYKADFHIVSWIKSAISAAAMTAWNTEQIYFMPKGHIGGATGYRMQRGGAQAMEGIGLEQVLYLMEQISQRNGYDPRIMRAMQVESELSADIDEKTGQVTWRSDLEGQYIVSEYDRILTLNSLDAVKFGVGKGIAETKDQLISQIYGDGTEWVEVGQESEEYMLEYLDDTYRGEQSMDTTGTQLQLALERAQRSRTGDECARHLAAARRHFSQLKSFARRSPGVAKYFMSDEQIEQIENAIRDIQQDCAKKSQDSRDR